MRLAVATVLHTKKSLTEFRQSNLVNELPAADTEHLNPTIFPISYIS